MCKILNLFFHSQEIGQIAGRFCESYTPIESLSSPSVNQMPFPYDIENMGLTPSMRDLTNQVIPTVCPMWRDIGIQLNLDVTILNEIDVDCLGLVRKCCMRMFEEWLKQDTDASWCTVLSACKKVKDNLSASPDEPRTKDYIEALNQLNSTLPAFLATL